MRGFLCSGRSLERSFISTSLFFNCLASENERYFQYIKFLIYHIRFEITGYSFNLIGSQNDLSVQKSNYVLIEIAFSIFLKLHANRRHNPINVGRVCKRIQYCCATLLLSRNKRHFGSCWLESTPNKTQKTKKKNMQ